MEQKAFIDAVASMTYTLEKTIFVAATLEGL